MTSSQSWCIPDPRASNLTVKIFVRPELFGSFQNRVKAMFDLEWSNIWADWKFQENKLNATFLCDITSVVYVVNVRKAWAIASYFACRIPINRLISGLTDTSTRGRVARGRQFTLVGTERCIIRRDTSIGRISSISKGLRKISCEKQNFVHWFSHISSCHAPPSENPETHRHSYAPGILAQYVLG